LTYVEIMLEAENEFYIEIADEDLERFRSVEDAVEFISRSFFTNWRAEKKERERE